MNLAGRIAIVTIVEFFYALFTRTWLRDHFNGIEHEVLTTLLRLFCIGIFLWLFNNTIFGKHSNVRRALSPLGLWSVALIFLTAILCGNTKLPDLTIKSVFAVTSVVVALKEEFFYRGILQNLLEPRCGTLWGVIVSNIAFTFYHFGVQQLDLLTLIELFTAGAIFGVLYAVGGSIMLVVVIHAADDVLYSFTPIVATPLPNSLGGALHILAFVLAIKLASPTDSADEAKM